MSTFPTTRSILVAWSLFLFSFAPPCMAADDILSSSVAREYAAGADVEIINAIAHALNSRVVIQYAPFKRRLSLLKSGQIDFVAGLLKRPEREAFIHYVLPPYKHRSDTVFFVRREQPAVIRRYQDLYPLRIGTILGSKYFPRFDNDPRLDKQPVHDSRSNFKKLIAGRIDAAVFPESVGIDLIHTMGIRGRVGLADYRYMKEKRVYIGISKKSRLIGDIETVERTITAMIESGEIRRIIIHHYTRLGLPIPVLQ